MIIFLFILLAITIVVFSFLYEILRKRVAKREKYKFVAQTRKSYLYSFYKIISKLRITKRYVNRIRKRYEIYSTKNQKELGKSVALIVIRSWLISSLLLIIAMIVQRSLFMFFTSFTVVYLVNVMIVNNAVEKTELKFLSMFEDYIDNMSHYYYKFTTIEDALYQSSLDVQEPIKSHVERIYSILLSEKYEEEISKYRMVIPNRYIKQFLSLCEKLYMYGDRKIDGESLFITNLTQLKKEINVDINNRNKLIAKLRGLSVLSIAPMFCLTWMKSWATSNVPTLKDYYSGVFGIGLVIIIYLATIFIFNILSILRFQSQLDVKKHPILKKLLMNKLLDNMTTNYTEKNYGKTLRTQKLIRKAAETITVKELILKQVLYSIVTIVICITVSLVVHKNKRSDLLVYVDNLTNVSTSANDKQIEHIKDTVKNYTNKYKGKEVTEEKIKRDIIAEGIIKNKAIMTITAEEISKRLKNYNSEYFKWYELVISFFISLVAFYIPHLMLTIKKKVIEMHMQDEVIQFQAIIFMMMHLGRISIEEILTSMEDYAIAFKQSISECINDYSSGEIEALRQLKEKESYEPFKKIVDNLIMCDSVDMKKAFSEILVDRKIYQDKRKVQTEILIDNKTIIATAISWVPFAISMIFYLILPFLTESMNEFVNYSNQIKNM